MEIKIDVTDWQEEFMDEEPNLLTKDAAIQTYVERGFHPAKQARMYIVAREMGQTDAELLPSTKLLTMTGGAAAWTRFLVSQMEQVTLPNGKTVPVRSWVAPVAEREYEPEDDDGEQFEMELEGAEEPPEPADDNPAVVPFDDPLAIDRATRYLLERVPGYIYGRLKIIAANKGDVFSVANDLHDKIDELARRLA